MKKINGNYLYDSGLLIKNRLFQIIVRNIISLTYILNTCSFTSFAVYDSGHRKEREVRKDSLNCLVFDYKCECKMKITTRKEYIIWVY